MATIQETLAPIDEKVSNEYASADIIKLFYNIDTIIEELNWWGLISKPFDVYSAQELSVSWGKLAILRSSLIQVQDRAIKNCRKIEASIKLITPVTRNNVVKALTEEATKNGKKPPTQGDIEAITDRNMASIKYELWLHEAYLEKVKSYWYSIPDILYRIETRIKILEWDKTTHSFYDFDISIPTT